jgi:thiamine biosynthesis lipoprotein
MGRSVWFAVCTIGATLMSVGAARQAAALPVIEWQGRTMGSPYTVKVVGAELTTAQTDELKSEVEQRLKEVNRQMSHYQPDSELSRFNRAPARTPFKVSPEFARVVRFSLELNRRSNGAFDPTLAPVINLWGFGEKTDQRAVPPEAELRAAMKITGCQHLSVTANDELVKDIPELTVNLSAVAKGFGVDEMANVLLGHGLTNIYVAIAGEVKVMGHNPRGTNWLVGISAPLAHWRENDPMAAVASLSDRAISTSGDYQKFFTDAQGRRLCHIVDPRTGWPVQHNVGGVSVVAPDSMTADALATTLFVLGQEAGLRFLESWTNAAALFIVREGEGKFRSVLSSRFSSLAGYQPR